MLDMSRLSSQLPMSSIFIRSGDEIFFAIILRLLELKMQPKFSQKQSNFSQNAAKIQSKAVKIQCQMQWSASRSRLKGFQCQYVRIFLPLYLQKQQEIFLQMKNHFSLWIRKKGFNPQFMEECVTLSRIKNDDSFRGWNRDRSYYVIMVELTVSQ